MPKGVFLIIHDEIRGPQIKCSYYTSPMSLPQEFISKLYMSHAGFKSSSHMEIKLGRYRSISCFTGNLDRRTHKEGILGILFEEGEEFDNLDLFLQRNLYQAINKPDDETMENIFSDKLQNYLNIIEFLEKVEVENMQEIFVITGAEVFKSCLLRIGDKQVSNSEMIEVYHKIINDQETPLYYHVKLDFEGNEKTFLIVKATKSNANIEKVLKTLKPYIEKFYYYSLEILTLFLFPSLIKLKPSKSGISKEIVDEKKSVLQNLKNSQNYAKEFNYFISKVIQGTIFISPELEI
ncbi:MAG: hypothetical protein EAX91_03530 [Candidatus Lokiarchaeota archaeon]|nr:hypothetical protein [Candidatus Lokiarchaeota archaeon]